MLSKRPVSRITVLCFFLFNYLQCLLVLFQFCCFRFQYVTVSHNIDPSIIWKLFTFYWKLFVPHIIITTIGNFTEHDNHWENITKKSWIFTKGSSPLCGYRTEACVVAIQKAKSFRSWKSLYAHHQHVSQGFSTGGHWPTKGGTGHLPRFYKSKIY